MRSPLNILLWKIGGAFVPFMALLTVPVHGWVTLNLGLIAAAIMWSHFAGYFEGRLYGKEN